MKNLEKYIKENKEELNSQEPSENVWKNVDNSINKKGNKKRNWLLVSGVASIALLYYLAIPKADGFNYEGSDLAQNKNKVPSKYVESKQEIPWNSNKEVEYEFRKQKKRENEGGKFFQGRAEGTVVYMFDEISVSDATCFSANTNTDDSKINNELREVDALRINYSTKTSDIDDSKDLNNGWNYDEAGNGGYERVDYIEKEEPIDPRSLPQYYYEQYDAFKENTFESPIEKPLSTFGIDVDNAAYSNARRFINEGYLPPKDAVKLEEFINYFDYNLPQPTGDHPFSITTELAACPWQKDNLLMQVAIQGERIERDDQKPNNLVFLLDVSGSMNQPNKLPLLKKSLKLLVKEMRAEDRISIVVYAGASGLVLPSTSGSEKEKIWQALENLNAGGGTAGGEGIELAYKMAMKGFKKEGNNRIILATDGDFNVGISDDDALIKLIEEKRKTGVFISVIGFGEGNLQSSKMEKIADNGNGNYNYIDNILEAKKVLVNEMGGTLIAIAKDVKLQLEFNPEYVKSYRLLGYENRMLETKDFDDDLKDAGDLGSGHSVIALYEIVPKDKNDKTSNVTNLRYQKKVVDNSKNLENEFAVIKFRYKKPKASKSILIEHVVTNSISQKPSSVFQFSSAVTEFGLLLRESNYRGNASYSSVLKRARANKGKDVHGYRAEFIQLVEKSQLMFEEYRLSMD